VSIFQQIISGDIPASFVYSDERCVAFLDIHPLAKGHTLVVPREEIDHWIDLSTETFTHIMHVAQQIARVQKRVFSCARVGLLIAGYDVPHTHIHVIPTNSMAEFDFANAGSATSKELAETAAVLSAAISEGV
jgi:histidine triad (HIT) family protein